MRIDPQPAPPGLHEKLMAHPVSSVVWVRIEDVQFNAWNPNTVASVEMDLLYESMRIDGITQPIVVYKLPDGKYEVVDGAHRTMTVRDREDIRGRTGGYLPVVVIDAPPDERMGSTIRHNRARGTHQIKAMSDIVVDLVRAGWDDAKISKLIGMDEDEVLRMRQISGLREMFANHEFSKSWEEFEVRNFPDEVGKTKTVAKAPVRS